MNIIIICVGGVKQSYYKQACAEYIKRLSPFAKVTVKEIKEHSHLAAAQAEEAETRLILPLLKGRVTAMDISGKTMDSNAFAGEIERSMCSGESTITFVIGGSNGLSDTVKQRADTRLSVSDMTFPHTLFRVILLEQIYRAFSIINKMPYHK